MWNRHRPRATTLTTGLLVVGMLAIVAEPAAAQARGGWEPTAGHLARTTAHFVGIAGGVVIVYLADVIRRRTGGSTVGACALLTEVGTALFVLVFLDMEAGHLLGTGLWSGTSAVGVTRLWWMVGLAAMVSLYALSFRTLLRDVGGG